MREGLKCHLAKAKNYHKVNQKTTNHFPRCRKKIKLKTTFASEIFIWKNCMWKMLMHKSCIFSKKKWRIKKRPIIIIQHKTHHISLKKIHKIIIIYFTLFTFFMFFSIWNRECEMYFYVCYFFMCVFQQ